ncbi:phosphoglycerate mutase [Scheffersomyces xylosifermentans]|uniref:phosphoglycerate mutase n=1 Tax=Scheffersomyces xylosifermentans TaxID=1304137 RepID=UPI00315DCC42
MATKPSELDVLDSHLSSTDAQEYQDELKTLEASLSSYWKFEVVPGVFKQSLKETDESKFNYLNEHFGILESWDEITTKLATLNLQSSEDESYKIFFLARHGQGFHNLAHSKYGDKAWNEYWSKLNGDGEIVWGPDPLLTELGISQAQENAAVWKQELSNNKSGKTDLILPTKWFVSPLSRSIDTLINTWGDIVDLKKVQPLIQENLRETTGVHTCDKRSPRRVIAKKYEPKGFRIETGFSEEDIYYKDDYRETVAEQSLRINKNLQQIFNENPEDSIISLTSHSGSIRAQLLVLGHRSFAVGTGGMIPVFVKATRHHNK